MLLYISLTQTLRKQRRIVLSDGTYTENTQKIHRKIPEKSTLNQQTKKNNKQNALENT